MMPSSTRVGYVVTQAGSEARTAAPVWRSNLQPCSGHTTVVPETIPSHSGPPLCGHSFSIVRKRSFRLKIAISRPHADRSSLPRRNVFPFAVTRVHLGLASCEYVLHWLDLERIRGMHRRFAFEHASWKGPWIFAGDPAFFAARVPARTRSPLRTVSIPNRATKSYVRSSKLRSRGNTEEKTGGLRASSVVSTVIRRSLCVHSCRPRPNNYLPASFLTHQADVFHRGPQRSLRGPSHRAHLHFVRRIEFSRHARVRCPAMDLCTPNRQNSFLHRSSPCVRLGVRLSRGMQGRKRGKVASLPSRLTLAAVTFTIGT